MIQWMDFKNLSALNVVTEVCEWLTKTHIL